MPPRLPTRLLTSTLCPLPPPFCRVCDGADVESGAYISLYDSTTETFTDAPSLPPQRSGYIELVCMVPTGWQQITVTYTPTFVTNKTLTFSLSASDVAKA